MTQSEYDMMIDIRNTIPYPKNSTVMQKIMPIDAEVWLFNKKEKQQQVALWPDVRM